VLETRFELRLTPAGREQLSVLAASTSARNTATRRNLLHRPPQRLSGEGTSSGRPCAGVSGRGGDDSQGVGVDVRRVVRVEYHWLEGKYNQLPALMANLVSRRVALIATPT